MEFGNKNSLLIVYKEGKFFKKYKNVIAETIFLRQDYSTSGNRLLEFKIDSNDKYESAKFYLTAENSFSVFPMEFENQISTKLQDEGHQNCRKRKVLFTNNNRDVFQLIITDAAKDDIETWCKMYNKHIENNRYVEMFCRLKACSYVKEILDSDIDDSEELEIIGYDEVYIYEKYGNVDMTI